MSRRFSSRVPYRGSMPGVISRDFFIKRLSDLRQDMQVWMLRKLLWNLNLQRSFGRNSAQHRVTSVGLQSDWRGLPIICRSCAQSRSRPAHSQVNFRLAPRIPRDTPVSLPYCLPFLFVIPQQSGGICSCSGRCLFLLVILAKPESPNFAVVCSCCHPERVFRARRTPMNSTLPQPLEPFSH